MKLQSKLMLSMAATALLAVAASLGIALYFGNQAASYEVEQKIKVVLNARHGELAEYLTQMRRDIQLLESDPEVVQALRDFSQGYAQRGDKAQTQLQQAWVAGNPHPLGDRAHLIERGDGSLYDRAHARHHPNLRQKVEIRAWQDLFLVDPKGNVVYSTEKESDFATNLVSGPWKTTGLARAVLPLLEKPVPGVPAFADMADYAPSYGQPAGFLAVPVLHPTEGLLGVVAIKLTTQRINRLMQEHEGLGESGETLIVGPDGWMLSDSRFDRSSTILRKQLKTEVAELVLAGETRLIDTLDYRGNRVFAAFKPLQVFPDALGGNVRWGVIAKINRDEALITVTRLRGSLLGVGLLTALLAVAAGLRVARTLSRPILAIQQALTRLAHGEETTVPGLARRDEIGAMAQAAESFRELARKTEHDRWIQENLGRLAAVISGQTSMQLAPELLLNEICALLDVPVAAFYLNDGQGNYRRACGHGLTQSGAVEDGFAGGEGIVGQCAKDRRPVVLSPVPAGIALIHAGLAEFPPHELVLYPILYKNNVLAVVELAALRSLTPNQHELLAAASARLGLHLANLRAAEHNRVLLAESRQLTEALEQQQGVLNDRNQSLQAVSEELKAQAEELKAQTEELKANQEEMRAQQEEMSHKNQALEAQGRLLETARQEAETRARDLQLASQYKSEFLANMSHELRTPLNSILILAKSLAENIDTHLTPEQAESAAVIHESGSQLLTLINDILDLSKIEAGRLEILAEDFAVDDLLAYLRRVFAPQAEKKGLAFAIEVDSAVPEILHGDRQRITQILTNLLSNAVKFTDAGTVAIKLARQDDQLRLDIHDTGIGIAADKLDHIFGVFQQLDGSTSRKYGGSGLGLAISRRLVDLMGGQLLVVSAPEQGSCFSLLLPNAATTAQPADKARNPAAARRRGDRNAVVPPAGRILVVEDDSRLVAILERLIDTLGYPVASADSGEKALQQVAAERPLGILLDLGLPGLSGMEVLRRLKADALSANIPVFIMSGTADTGEAKTLGAVGFLKKPVTKDMIAAALRTMGQLHAQVCRKQVLVVEDDATCVADLRQRFAHDPLDLTVVAEGKAALALLGQQQYDGIILDLRLTDMSGFECLERLAKESPRHPPVVVYSAGELKSEELLFLREHTEAVITKGPHAHERLREELLLALSMVAAVAAPTPATAVPTGCHLLLVDDDVRNLFALSRALRERGFAVTVAEAGAKALEVLRGGRFDALLTDIMMPDMDGYELIRRIRALGYVELPIVAVTAKAMPGDSARCLEVGANAYISKPVDVDRLVERLREWL